MSSSAFHVEGIRNGTLSCVNITVDESVLDLEEGYGRAYDLEDEGYNDWDEDSVTTDLYFNEDNEFVALKLGTQASTDPEEDDAWTPSTKEWESEFGDVNGYEFTTYHQEANEGYVVRYFNHNQMAILYYIEDFGGERQRVATLDCRPGAKAPDSWDW